MKIRWLGHSSFRLENNTGATIVTDPYSGIGLQMPKVSAHAVTVSHLHHDHAFTDAVEGSPLLLSKPGDYEVSGVHIKGINTYHDNDKGALRGNNTVFKYRMDGMEVCHLGDIGQDITPEIVKQLMPVNILLIPVGGTYTLDARQAKSYVEKLMPDIVIPMHYKVKNLNIDIAEADCFTRHFEPHQIEKRDRAEIEINREDLAKAYTRIIILNHLDN